VSDADDLVEAKAEIERLRAGEDHTPCLEGVWPTPGQWIARWNSLSADERLDRAARILQFSQEASECFTADHKGRLEEAERWRRQFRSHPNLRYASCNADCPAHLCCRQPAGADLFDQRHDAMGPPGDAVPLQAKAAAVSRLFAAT
jgi:hypothetical protein